jgi:sulfoxide reductase heme-binding subunit YedZ
VHKLNLGRPVPALVLLAPIGTLILGVSADAMGPNPQEALIRELGQWTIRLLAVVLAITPLRQVFGWVSLLQYRRMIGLFVFFYGSLHLLAYVVFDKAVDLAEVWIDVMDRPFITVGILAWVMLLVLAITSPKAILRRLGPNRWKRIHQMIYVVALLAVLHFFWMRTGKLNFGEVWLWGGVLFALLLMRTPPIKERLIEFGRRRARRSA